MSENIEVDSKSKGNYFLSTRTDRIIFLVILTLISAGPIIFRDAIPGHADWHSHASNAYHFKRGFCQGVFLPRWMEGSVNGYGMPRFNYYAPLPYYFFTLLDLFFRNSFNAIKWNLVLTIALTTVFGYIYLRSHGSAIATTIASVFVIFSPAVHMHAYTTSFISSLLAIPFILLTLYGIDTFNQEKGFDIRSFLITSSGYALTILAHLTSAFMLTILLIPYFFLSRQIYKTKKFVKCFISSIIFGICLAGFYFIPALLELKLAHSEVINSGNGKVWDYKYNFMFTYLDRPTSEGYGWQIFDHRYFELSTALFCLASLICLITLLCNMDKLKDYLPTPFKVNIAIIMFIITFLMLTPVSIFIWIIIEPMKMLQFPWRFIVFLVPFGGAIMVYAFDLIGKLLKEKVNTKSYKLICSLIAISFIFLFYVNFINMFRWPWAPSYKVIRSALNETWHNNEYLPNLMGGPDLTDVNFDADFTPTILSSNQEAKITLIKWLSHDRIFQVFSDVGHELRLRTFYFPGWNIYIDEIQANLSTTSGCMVVHVPPGRHEIRVRFELTPLRKASTYISLSAFLLFIYFFLQELFPIKLALVNLSKKNEIANIDTTTT